MDLIHWNGFFMEKLVTTCLFASEPLGSLLPTLSRPVLCCDAGSSFSMLTCVWIAAWLILTVFFILFYALSCVVCFICVDFSSWGKLWVHGITWGCLLCLHWPRGKNLLLQSLFSLELINFPYLVELTAFVDSGASPLAGQLSLCLRVTWNPEELRKGVVWSLGRRVSALCFPRSMYCCFCSTCFWGISSASMTAFMWWSWPLKKVVPWSIALVALCTDYATGSQVFDRNAAWSWKEALYDIFGRSSVLSLDSSALCFQRTQAFTRGPAVLEPKEGGKFKLLGGNIEGTFVELVSTVLCVMFCHLHSVLPAQCVCTTSKYK